MEKLTTLLITMLLTSGYLFCQDSKSLTKQMEKWDDFKMSKDVYFSFNSGLQVTDLETALKTPDAVFILDLSYAELTAVPDNILKLKNLEDLNLSGNLIVDWNATIEKLGKLPKLRKLFLSNCSIDKLPDNISSLKSLEVLELRFNNLVELPKAIGKLEKLEYLRLYNNRSFKTIPIEIGNLSNLEYFDIAGTKTEILPEELTKCRNLKNITANACKIKSLPINFGNMNQLILINFGFNQIEAIPKSISQCKKLVSISFGGNQIREIPIGFGQLKSVRFCNLAKNNLTEFSKELTGLESVQNLWLHENAIPLIPTEITKLKILIQLLIDAPEIKNIDEIRKLMPDLSIVDED